MKSCKAGAGRKRQMKKLKQNKKGQFEGVAVVIGAIAVIFGIIMLLSGIAIVPAGSVGVYDLFGTVSQYPMMSGFHFKNPFASVIGMSVKTQEMKEEANVPSKEGLSIQLEISILYKLQPDKAVEVYKTVGVGYPDVIITPQFRSVVRDITVRYEAKDLYTKNRAEIEQQIFDELKEMLEPRGVTLEKVLLRGMTLPTVVSDAIGLKMKALQEAEQMDFVNQKAQKEAERKVIEAGGIAQANAIISGSLTRNYLTWYWIQGLQTNQMQIVYVPIGDNGMPLFKDIDNIQPNYTPTNKT